MMAVFTLARVLALVGATVQANATGQPRFEDYPVGNIYKGTPAAPVLSTPDARRFQTQLRKHASFGPNFAGQFVLARWGCGAGCVIVAVIDSTSGAVSFAPFQFQDGVLAGGQGPARTCHHASDFQIDSELFIARGDIGGKVGTHYYRWHNRRLSLVHFSPSCE
jgi:hypothetical protein